MNSNSEARHPGPHDLAMSGENQFGIQSGQTLDAFPRSAGPFREIGSSNSAIKITSPVKSAFSPASNGEGTGDGLGSVRIKGLLSDLELPLSQVEVDPKFGQRLLHHLEQKPSTL